MDETVNSDGAGVLVASPNGHNLMSIIHFLVQVTNNDAEYEALITGLKFAVEMKVNCLAVYCDSILVVYQLRGNCQARGPRTESYMRCAQELIQRFKKSE